MRKVGGGRMRGRGMQKEEDAGGGVMRARGM